MLVLIRAPYTVSVGDVSIQFSFWDLGCFSWIGSLVSFQWFEDHSV